MISGRMVFLTNGIKRLQNYSRGGVCLKIVTNDMMVQDQFRDKYIAIQEIRKSIRVLLELKKHADFEKLFAGR